MTWAGTPPTTGTRTRWRTLFRADGLGELTEADISASCATWASARWSTCAPAHELEQSRFDVDAHPVAFHHFPFIDELPDAEELDRRPGLLGAQYKEMLEDAGGQILGALEVLAAPDALPAVFHCTAGKDRTGVLSAIVLSLLGVPEETVVADYALSGEAMQRLRAKLILKYPEGRETIENIDEVFSADPAQMELLSLPAGALRLRSAPYVERARAPGRDWSSPARRRCCEPVGLGPEPPSPARTSGRRRSMAPARARSSSGEAARVVRGEGQAHRVPADVDVGVVVGRLGGGADGVDEGRAAAKSCSLTVVTSTSPSRVQRAAAPRARRRPRPG